MLEDKKEEIKESIKLGKCSETLEEIKAMTDDDLQDNIKLYTGDAWRRSPEFEEVLRRKKNEKEKKGGN